MKKIIFLLCLLSVYLSSFGQSPVLNTVVRNNTLSPAKVANALDALKVFTASGTNAYAITPNLNIYDASYVSGWTYTSGDIFKVTFSNTNTSATITLNVNGEGPVAVKDSEGNNLGVGDLKVGAAYIFYHNGTHFRMVGGSGGASSTTFQSLVDGPGSFTGKTLNYPRVNAGENALEYRTPSQVRSDIGAGTGSGDALVANPLSQFASTTSSQLAGVISDETGTGALVFGTSPTFTTPNIGAATGSITGNAATVTTNANLTGPITSVGNATSIASKTGTGTKFVMDTSPTLVTPALGVPSAGDFSTGTFTWPTFNQNTTGSAASLTTGRTISITGDIAYTSTSFNGTANVTAAGTLATVNSNVGTFGSATQAGTFTVNGKGLITAASNVTITPAIGSVTGLGTGVSGALSVNTGSTGAYSRRILYKNTSSSSLTGTTSETSVRSAFIPANTLQAGDMIYIELINTKGVTTGTAAGKIYANTTNSLISSTQMAQSSSMGTTDRWYKQTRTWFVRGTANTLTFGVSTGQASDTQLASGASSTITAVDWTVDQYIILAFTLSNSGDTVTNELLLIELVR